MRKRVALLFVVAAACGGFAHGPSALSASRVSACTSSYVSAHLSWGNKCLRAGEFCKIGNIQYARYGFVCPSTGHLRRR